MPRNQFNDVSGIIICGGTGTGKTYHLLNHLLEHDPNGGTGTGNRDRLLSHLLEHYPRNRSNDAPRYIICGGTGTGKTHRLFETLSRKIK